MSTLRNQLFIKLYLHHRNGMNNDLERTKINGFLYKKKKIGQFSVSENSEGLTTNKK